MNMGSRGLFTITGLVGETAELPIRCGPAKAVDMIAPYTIVITLVYNGVEGRSAKMVYFGEARQFFQQGHYLHHWLHKEPNRNHRINYTFELNNWVAQ